MTRWTNNHNVIYGYGLRNGDDLAFLPLFFRPDGFFDLIQTVNNNSAAFGEHQINLAAFAAVLAFHNHYVVSFSYLHDFRQCLRRAKRFFQNLFL